MVSVLYICTPLCPCLIHMHAARYMESEHMVTWLEKLFNNLSLFLCWLFKGQSRFNFGISLSWRSWKQEWSSSWLNYSENMFNFTDRIRWVGGQKSIYRENHWLTKIQYSYSKFYYKKWISCRQSIRPVIEYRTGGWVSTFIENLNIWIFQDPWSCFIFWDKRNLGDIIILWIIS